MRSLLQLNGKRKGKRKKSYNQDQMQGEYDCAGETMLRYERQLFILPFER